MTEKLDQKLARRQAAAPNTPAPEAAQKFRTSEKVEAKIEAFIAADPKYVEYVKNLPRERLERVLFLREAELGEFRQARQENRQRFRQAADTKILQWLESRPEIKAEIEAKIANLPKERQDGMRARLGHEAAEREGMKSSQSTGGPKL